jgi:hypothetical protein
MVDRKWTKESIIKYLKEKNKDEVFIDMFVKDKGYQKQKWVTLKCQDINHPEYSVWWNNFIKDNNWGKCPCCMEEYTGVTRWTKDKVVDFHKLNGFTVANIDDWSDVDSFSAYIQKEFGYVPYKNSNVYSFPVEGFQVDITLVSVEEYNTSISYTSWGDLGNLMGRIYHKMGLHYGHNGLSFWIRQGLFDNNVAWSDNDHVYDKLVLTTDSKKIFEIVCFDYNKWLQGFDSEQEVWDFIINSKYFDSKIFSLENLNNINRVRNKKRGMYMRFLEHVNDKTLPTGKQFLSKHEYGLIFQEEFHQLKSAIARYRHEYEVGKAVKDKFNGSLVQEWIKCSHGPSIGKIIKSVKDAHGSSSLLRMDVSEIKALVEKFALEFKIFPDSPSAIVEEEDRKSIMSMAPLLLFDEETCNTINWKNYYNF